MSGEEIDPVTPVTASTGVGAPSNAYSSLMAEALNEAAIAGDAGDVPVGAIVADADGIVIGRGRNEREARNDPTAHAEVIALRRAATERGTWRLSGCTLAVTLEPCLMCAGAALSARLERILLGAWDDKGGATGSVWDVVRDRRANHRINVVSGVRDSDCARLLSDFFASRR